MISITQRPYKNNFSKNPIVYQLYDADAAADITKTFEVKVIFITSSGAATTVASFPLVPYLGYAQADISSLVHNFLQHSVPAAVSGTVVQASTQCSGLFYIQYRTVVAGATTTQPFITSEEEYKRRVWWGGVAAPIALGSVAQPFFADNSPQLPATYQLENLLLPAQYAWLGWYNTRFTGLSGTNIDAQVLVTFTDGTQQSFVFAVEVPGPVNLLPAYSLIYIPVGYTQLNLAALNPAKTVYRWELSLLQGTNTVMAPVVYELDLRSEYNDMPLYTRNSVGGFDTLQVRGTIDEELSYETEEIALSGAADWQQQTQLPLLRYTRTVGEQQVYSINTGLVPQPQQDALRDILLNREVYWLRNGRFYPLNILTQSVPLRSSDDFVFSMPIQFTLGLPIENNYTPFGYLPATAASSNVCSSSISIDNQAENPGTSTSQFTFDYTLLGDAPQVQWKLHTDTIWNTVTAGNQLTITVPRPGTYIIQLRALCADGSEGATVVRAFQATDGSTPPSNNSQVVNNLSSAVTYILYNGATVVSAGDLAAGASKGFYIADGSYSLSITVTGLASYGTLVSSGGNIYGLASCTFTGGGQVEINPMSEGGTN